MAKMHVDLLEETATGVTIRVHTPPPQGFADTFELFAREVDADRLMGDALSRTPQDAAIGVLEELIELAQLWEVSDE